MKSKMAAPMNITRNSVVLTLLLVLTTVFVINILQCIKLKYHEQPSIAISITLKCSRINLINNFANLKPKLRRNSIAFPVSVEDVNKTTLLVLLLIIAGDIEVNPGPCRPQSRPRNESIFPCGICQLPVTWSHFGVCCDECNVWHHKSCEDIDSKEIEQLNRTSVVWYCCICESVNIDSFTFNSYELHTMNMFFPLSGTTSTLDSLNSSTPFSPLHTSSPRNRDSSRKSSAKSVSTDKSRINSKSSVGNDLLPRKTNLRLLNVNCCSIREHKQEFTAALDYVKPDIICGTESWLKGVRPGKPIESNAIKNCEIFPDNYIFHRNDRASRGGGVFTGVSKSLIAIEQPQLVTNCEIVCTKVKLKNEKDLYLASFYMPHRNINDLNNLDQSLKKLSECKKSKHIILSGDFNCPDIDWENLNVNANAQDKNVQQALIDLSIEHGLTQVHSQPTREGNILDLVFTNNPSLVKSSTSIPGISDHAMVVTDSDVKPIYNIQTPRKVYLFSKANWKNIFSLCENLSSDIVKMVDQSPDIQSMWDKFKNDLNTIIEKNVPSKTFKKKNTVPWFNRSLKRMTKRKARLYRAAKKSKQWNEFKQYQRLCKKEFKKAEISYVNETIQNGFKENNCKPFWRYIKSKKQDNIGVAPLKSKGNLFCEGKDKAQILFDQFSSVFTRRDKRVLPPSEKQYKSKLPPLDITTPGIEKLLTSLKVAKAIGPDNIPNIILKTCAKQLAPGIRQIFQTSVDSGELPSDWVNANVTPVFKSGDVHLAENYRPVSLTSVLCKNLEHIICKHLLNHLERNNILTNLNHGFRSGFSCETQLLVTMNDLLSFYDEGIQTDVIILDFSKAFDTVPHDELLYKLECFGITGTIHTWLKTFLTKRFMQVVVDGEVSQKSTVDSGVPQGTVLGPLMFLCHINDLPLSVKSQVRLFADDCLLYRKIKTQKDFDILQNDLKELEKWADKWGMRFNAKKCYVMSIKNKTPHFYSLCDHILKQVPDNPYLGLTLSEDLTWSTHISKLTKKANSTMALLRRNLKNCPIDCRKTAYLALVRSCLDYGSSIWDPYLSRDIDKIEQVQKQAARFITGDYKSRTAGSVTNMLKHLELPPLEERRKNNRLVMLYKVAEGLVPAIPASDYLKPARVKRQIKAKQYSDCVTSNIIDKQVINNDRGFVVKNSNSSQFKNSFFVKTVLEWNHLDSRVVHAETVEGFKAALHFD